MGVYEVSCGEESLDQKTEPHRTRLYHGNLKKHASDAQKPMLAAYATARVNRKLGIHPRKGTRPPSACLARPVPSMAVAKCKFEMPRFRTRYGGSRSFLDASAG